MNFLTAYNQPIGTIFYQGYGERIVEYRLCEKYRAAFGELCMTFETGLPFDRAVLPWREYDDPPLLRLNPAGSPFVKW
jgi:hypothetical protein